MSKKQFFFKYIQFSISSQFNYGLIVKNISI